jgi:hypothetical protein
MLGRIVIAQQVAAVSRQVFVGRWSTRFPEMDRAFVGGLRGVRERGHDVFTARPRIAVEDLVQAHTCGGEIVEDDRDEDSGTSNAEEVS